MIGPAKLIAGGIMLLLTLISGFFVTHAGRPLNTALFSLHKISALAATVLLVLLVWQFHQNGVPISDLTLVLILISELCFLALFVSGAFLSFEKEFPIIVLKIHQITPILSLLCSSAAIYVMIQHQA